MTEYRFKPLVFHKAPVDNPRERYFAESVHGIVCKEDSLLTYGYHEESYDTSYPDGGGYIRRYNSIAGRWENINCKNLSPGIEFRSSTILLSGNMIIIHGVISEEFSEISFSRTYIGNLSHEKHADGIIFDNISNTDKTPNEGYDQSIVMDGQYIYCVGRISDCKQEIDVCRFDLSTKKWKYLYDDRISGLQSDFDWRFFGCKLAYYNYSLYMFDEISFESFVFQKIRVFDLSSNEWTYQRISPDRHSSNELYPKKRYYYGFAQCVSQPNFIYICGGKSSFGYSILSDIWGLDLITLQWCNLMPCKLSIPTTLMSFNISPSGRLYYYTGEVESFYEGHRIMYHTENIHFIWLRVPKLKEICWEAMKHYFRNQMLESSKENLKKLGLPSDYYAYVVKAKTLL